MYSLLLQRQLGSSTFRRGQASQHHLASGSQGAEDAPGCVLMVTSSFLKGRPTSLGDRLSANTHTAAVMCNSCVTG